MNQLVILAQDAANCEEAAIVCSPLWQNVIEPASSALAYLAVVVGLFFLAKNAMASRPNAIVKTLVGTIAAAALLMNIDQVGTLIDFGWGIIETVLDTVKGLFGFGEE